MPTDKEILNSDGDWTDLRHEVCRIMQKSFPDYDVTVDGDYILLSRNGQPWVLLEQIRLRLYRTKINSWGNPGDPRSIVGGGREVSADGLIEQIRQDLTHIDDRRKRVPSTR